MRPYVLVTSVFDGGAYRVANRGRRVMFQHGSLHEVVDQEERAVWMSAGCGAEEQ